MKFFSTALIASLFTSFFSICALAQSVALGAPAQGSTITAGSQIIVEVDRPNGLTPTQEVAIVIAITPCSGGSCPNPSDILGSVLYQGSFNPQYSADPSDHLPPHQSINVTIPASLPKGPAQISVVHLALLEAGPHPLYEIKTTTVIVD